MADVQPSVGPDASLAGLVARLRGGAPGGNPGLFALLAVLVAGFSALIPRLREPRHAAVLHAAVPRCWGCSRSP